jgi:hypothetical protein
MTPRSAASGVHLHNPKAFAATVLLALLAAACGRDASSAAAPTRTAPLVNASADAPVVVEEFQSQGCSSCPPANANINAIAGRPEILALSFAVTYWDQLGWKDTFDQPAFTQRQWDYAHFAGRGNVATPQVIVDGKTAIVGSDRDELEKVIAKEGAPTGGPAITTASGKISVAGAKAAWPATVWLVRYDPNVRWVSIRAGENDGKKLPHRNIVRELVALGDWTGRQVSFVIPAPKEAGLRSAVLVQSGKGGPIIAARRV